MKELLKSLIISKPKGLLSTVSTHELLSELLKRGEIPFTPENEEEALKLNLLKTCWPNITPNQLYYILSDN